MIQSEEVKTDRNHTVPDIDTVTTTSPPLRMILRWWKRQGNYTLHDTTLSSQPEWLWSRGRDREVIPYMTLLCHIQNVSEAVEETGKLYRTWHYSVTSRMFLRQWKRQGNYTVHDTTLSHPECFWGIGRDREIIPYMTLLCHIQNVSEALGETGKLYRTWHSIVTSRMFLRHWERQGNYTVHDTTLSHPERFWGRGRDREIIPYMTLLCHIQNVSEAGGETGKLYRTWHYSVTSRTFLRQGERQGNYAVHDTTLSHPERFWGRGRDREIMPYMTQYCHNRNDSEAVGETGKLYRTWHSIVTTTMILRRWEKQGNYTLHDTTLSQAVGETEIIPYTTQHCHNHLTTWKALRHGWGEWCEGGGDYTIIPDCTVIVSPPEWISGGKGERELIP